MSYECLVGRIKVRPHPNADRLQLGTVCGEQVIVGLDVQDGDLMLYFPEGGQLSEQFANGNDLVMRKNPDGSRAGGFFSEKRRVVAQSFRGAKSYGFAIEPDSLVRAGFSALATMALREGDRFSELDKKEVCRKYITPATMRAATHAKKTRKSRDLIFPQHVNTSQLAHCVNSLPSPAMCHATEKLHGTSARYGKVLEKSPRGWLRRLLRLPAREQWVPVAGTRRVVLDALTGAETSGYHGSNAFRFDVLDPSILRNGELVYGEIVGYSSDGKPIMPRHSALKLDREFKERFGTEICYDYGCPEGTHRFYVYRICNTATDGRVIDLSWPEVKRRCKELGLRHVPELWSDWYTLTKCAADTLLNDHDRASASQLGGMAEGVVLRLEHAGGVDFYKHKCYEFKVMEGIIKECDDYVDEEEAS